MYKLMSKDRVVATFELVSTTSLLGTSSVSVSDLNIVDRKLYLAIVGGRQLEEFLKNRKAPKHREHIAKLFSYLDMNSLESFLNMSYGLSLNDDVWVCPETLDVPWARINMYDNKFSEVIAHYAFSGIGLAGMRLQATSPEYTTDGVLPKCWIRENDGTVWLLKGSTIDSGFLNAGFEPQAEFYATQIAKRMGLYPYVEYDLRMVNGKLCSICPIFTSESTAYISMAQELLRRMMTEAGFERVLAENKLIESYKDIVFFDCVICNPDRHLGNFGLFKDTVDYSTVGLSPIFDNGRGLGSMWVRDNYDKDSIVEYTAKEGPRLFDGRGYVSVGRLYLNERRRAALERLNGWTIPKHSLYNWPDWKYEAMNELLQHQVRHILN